MLVGDFIRLNALARGGDEALSTPDRAWSYAELNDDINRVAAGLLARGIGRGDRVAALARNRAEYILLYYATAKVGALLVPLNYWHRETEHRYTLGDSTPSLLFVANEFRPVVAAILDDTGLPTVAFPEPDDDAAWTEFLAPAPAGPGVPEPDAEVQESDPHMILYTSGTTGRPKGALLSHRRTADDAMAMVAALGIRPSDAFLNFFPPFHVGNWDHMKLYHLAGARMVLIPAFDAGDVLRTIEEKRITVLLAVPAMWHDLLGHSTFATTDRSSVRVLYYGAYDPSGLMMRVAEEFGAQEGRVLMYHTYGLTEAGPFVAICHPHELFDHFGSIGRAMPGVEIALLGPDLAPVPAGSAGEICIRGPHMTGYWNKPEESAAALAGGWLHTGDVAVADPDGYLRIVDRLKDTIRSGGHNVYSKEVENVLLLHESVEDCAVIGVPDDKYEEKVVAVVVLRAGFDGGDSQARALQDYVRREAAGYNVPKEIHFTERLPKSSVGKTLKHELRSTFGSVFPPSTGSDRAAAGAP
ncbi:AMP-binding protein [Nakamurella sp. YIM 132087]|uniref:AMP-binding protein n=1 Tax=Nakamurella alba TaxID=2665158 RepID=A0A7K1FIK3_9ACTN|nr:AMP-binding protein [Nakamurella alba]MTD13906.1 AMP-binding protein [Nakamurella alba]